MEEKEKESHFKGDAKTIVDMLFDNGLFKEKLTRDDMNALEDLIRFTMDSRYDSYVRFKEIMSKIDKRNQN